MLKSITDLCLDLARLQRDQARAVAIGETHIARLLGKAAACKSDDIDAAIIARPLEGL